MKTGAQNLPQDDKATLLGLSERLRPIAEILRQATEAQATADDILNVLNTTPEERDSGVAEFMKQAEMLNRSVCNELARECGISISHPGFFNFISTMLYITREIRGLNELFERIGTVDEHNAAIKKASTNNFMDSVKEWGTAYSNNTELPKILETLSVFVDIAFSVQHHNKNEYTLEIMKNRSKLYRDFAKMEGVSIEELRRALRYWKDVQSNTVEPKYLVRPSVQPPQEATPANLGEIAAHATEAARETTNRAPDEVRPETLPELASDEETTEELLTSEILSPEQVQARLDLAKDEDDVSPWRKAKAQGKSLPDYVARVYAAEIKAGTLTKTHLHRDEKLYEDYYNWRRRRNLPRELHWLRDLPTGTQKRDEQLANAGINPADAGIDDFSPEEREVIRRYEAIRRRTARARSTTAIEPRQ